MFNVPCPPSTGTRRYVVQPWQTRLFFTPAVHATSWVQQNVQPAAAAGFDVTVQPPSANIAPAATSASRSDHWMRAASTGSVLKRVHGDEGVERAVHVTVICNRADEVGIAVFDLASFRLSLTQIADTPSFSKTISHIIAARPTEIAVPSNLAASRLATALTGAFDDQPTSFVTLPRRCFNDTAGVTRLQHLMATVTPAGGRAVTNDDVSAEIQDPQRYLCCAAAAAMLARIEQSQQCTIVTGTLRVAYVALAKHVEIDRSAISSLELLAPPRRSGVTRQQQSGISTMNPISSAVAPAALRLSEAIDATVTRMGQRMLRSNLLQPISHVPTINLRLDTVGVLLERMSTATLPLKCHLQSFGQCDVDSILGLFACEPTTRTLAHAVQIITSLISVRRVLSGVVQLSNVLVDAGTPDEAAAVSPDVPLRHRSALLESIAVSLEALNAADLIAQLDAILDTPMLDSDQSAFRQAMGQQVQRCFAVRSGIDTALDEARRLYSASIESLVAHCEELKRVHNIPSMRLLFDPRRGFHLGLDGRHQSQLDPAVFSHISSVNANAQAQARPQSSRVTCTTPTLVRLSNDSQNAMADVLVAQDAAVQPLVGLVRANMSSLHVASEAIALLDVILSHVSLITTFGGPAAFVRPALVPYGPLRLVDARPLTVANAATQSIDVNGSNRTLAILTGPNGSGKSTLLRSIAQWILLAHIGSYVPAACAEVPLLEGICTRFTANDASDASASGFFRDMADLGHVTRVAKRRFLVLLDEVGRGTSTAEGCGIAWAVAERLADLRCITFLSTHFDALTKLPMHVSCAFNLHLKAVPVGRGLNFEFKVSEGPCSVSHYGLVLASMIGFPPEMIEAARRNADILEGPDDSTGPEAGPAAT